jgi:membrane protein required for colicin V production
MKNSESQRQLIQTIVAIANRIRSPKSSRREPRMNSFDAVVYAALAVAMTMGFNAGLLRSAVTILAYLIAMPIAVWATSLVSRDTGGMALMQNPLPFLGTFLLAGILLGKLMRMAIDETIGTEAGIADRIAGAALGAVRVGLIAVSVVFVFDQLVPADRQPPYLVGSRLRPLLSAAGQTGLKSLPPDITAYIDRLKQDRRI